MSKPIDGMIVRRLRSTRTQTELAKLAKINKDTLSRIERGKQPGGGRVVRALAKALGVDQAVLTGDAPITRPDDGTEGGLLGSRYRLIPARLDDATHNAFRLASFRYGVSIELIADMAPFLFVLAAERSLARRRKLVAELESGLKEADLAADKFNHLPNTFLPSHALNEMLGSEAESIDKLDILADKLQEDSIWSFHIHRHEYEHGEQNPFVRSLQEEATNPDIASVTSVSMHEAEYKVCRAQALLVAGGDGGLADAIISGVVSLSDMPAPLWRPAALEDRLVWLRDRVAEWKAATDKLFAEFDLITPDVDFQTRGKGIVS